MDSQKPTNGNPKVFDITPPGNTPATPTGRPVIPDSSPQQPDPMLNAQKQPEESIEPDNLSSQLTNPPLTETSPNLIVASETQGPTQPTIVNHDLRRPKISRVLLVAIMSVIIISMTIIGIVIYLRIVY
ncbi:MAG TPA: hypothetical protein VMR18_00380 [Candidatus Saccharimonadales bacterium]|nr:hypothetical protein [Candidatus Saccharimonadales bacterium]